MGYENYWAIVTAEQREEANEKATLFTSNTNTFSIPLSPTGVEPATHWGGHGAIAPDEETALAKGVAADVRSIRRFLNRELNGDRVQLYKSNRKTMETRLLDRSGLRIIREGLS